LRTFRLPDPAFAALAAGRPSAETLGELRKAQLSRHLLLLRELLPATTFLPGTPPIRPRPTWPTR
jgi:HEXXH motif-containing protein